MAAIDQQAELLGRTPTTGRRIQRGWLIAERCVGVELADRHQLDVGEAHILDIAAEFVGMLLIGQPAMSFFRPASPGA